MMPQLQETIDSNDYRILVKKSWDLEQNKIIFLRSLKKRIVDPQVYIQKKISFENKAEMNTFSYIGRLQLLQIYSKKGWLQGFLQGEDK